MITPKRLHYRRTHAPVPVVDAGTYRLSIGLEGAEPRYFSMSEIREAYREHELVVTLMCTGNRRSEFNTEKDGETMGLPWKNGSISTASWAGPSLREVLKAAGIDPERTEEDGYHFLTFYGLENYHVSIPIRKAFARDGDCILAWKMNGETLPRDHGFPLRVIVPGLVGARSVKWLQRIVVTRDETEGMHQKGIAYKQLGPNQKVLSEVAKEHIYALPPIDHVPITSAITAPEPGATVLRGSLLTVAGYAFSGAGLAVIRVDVSVDGGETWAQAELKRASESQQVRSGRAWAWVQWRLSAMVPENAPGNLTVLCKAIDDQYNQQPHEPSSIWNLRGILNTSWGRVDIATSATPPRPDMTEAAFSGDGTVQNVGVRLQGKFQCEHCRQKFDTQKAEELHYRFIHDPNRHQED